MDRRGAYAPRGRARAPRAIAAAARKPGDAAAAGRVGLEAVDGPGEQPTKSPGVSAYSPAAISIPAGARVAEQPQARRGRRELTGSSNQRDARRGVRARRSESACFGGERAVRVDVELGVVADRARGRPHAARGRGPDRARPSSSPAGSRSSTQPASCSRELLVACTSRSRRCRRSAPRRATAPRSVASGTPSSFAFRSQSATSTAESAIAADARVAGVPERARIASCAAAGRRARSRRRRRARAASSTSLRGRGRRVRPADAALAAGVDLDDDERRRVPLERAVGLRARRSGSCTPDARTLRPSRGLDVRRALSTHRPGRDRVEHLPERAGGSSRPRVRVARERGLGEVLRLLERDVRRQRRHLRVDDRLEHGRAVGGERLVPGVAELVRVVDADPVQADQLGVLGVREVGDRLASPRTSGRPPSPAAPTSPG